MIKVKHLTKRFGTTRAVDDVSFEVSRGEVVGFLGPNGAGKTTTMRILTCFLPADEGSASIADYDIFNDSLQVRQRVGYLPESAPSYTDMEIIEFLEYIARLRTIPKDQIRPRIKQMIEICGLGKELGKTIGQLSKGYRQRVGLAQSLIHDPDILILDEPTSGLDPNQIVEIRQLIKEIGKKKTIILSTHILPEVTATCNRVIIINKGKIVADGTAESLTESHRGGEDLIITMRGPLADIKEFFDRLDGVKFYKPLGSEDSIHQFKLKVTKGPEVEENIFLHAAQHDWLLRKMYRETISLEDVFKQLTTEEGK